MVHADTCDRSDRLRVPGTARRELGRMQRLQACTKYANIENKDGGAHIVALGLRHPGGAQAGTTCTLCKHDEPTVLSMIRSLPTAFYEF
jgi:hypothetical protein